jgi:hypothetical protein
LAACIKLLNGTPTPTLDGTPTFAGFMWTTTPTADGWEQAPIARLYADAGIHLYAFDIGAGGPTPEWCGPGSGRTSPYDLTTVEARLGRILDVDPEARFHFRVYLEMRQQWWYELYPDEREVDSEGTPLTQSFASTVWREQAQEFLRRYIAHLESIGLSDRAFAYQTGAGHTGEWVKGLTSMRSPCGDYSAPMRRHFRAWLRGQYADDGALRAAWGDPDVSLETAEVPSAAEQLSAPPASTRCRSHHCFRDPAREGKVIDYYRCLADLCADLVIGFNRTVKEATAGRSLTGAFFGYLMELAWNAGFFAEGPDSPYSTYQRSGHLGLGKVLRSPYVDFIVSPYSYGFRGIGGHGAPMPPIDSLRLHGKLYIYEDDTRTHLAPADAGFGRAASLPDSEAILKRNMAEVLTRGMGIWWLAGRSHVDPLREPAFEPLLKRFQELGAFALRLDRTPCAEIAVLVDDESLLYCSVRNDLDVPLIFQQRLWGLPRLGAPIDTYLLQDLIEGRLPPFKLYVFLNTFRLDGARREALARQVRRDGRVALWIYAPGYIRDAPGLEHMADLTGFRFGMGEHAWGPTIHITDYQHPITQGLSQDLSWGTNSRLAPLFHLEDQGAHVLGEVVYSQGRCKPGFGVREFADWTSIYAAAPNLPASVLRGIARYAGAHLYGEAGDVLYAIPQLLGVHTVAGGERTFALPRQVEVVYDLYERRQVAQGVDRFRVTLPPRSTVLYYTGTRDLLAGLDGLGRQPPGPYARHPESKEDRQR